MARPIGNGRTAREATIEDLCSEFLARGRAKNLCVPDARISASFSLWFETKTAAGQVRKQQLQQHLGHLTDKRGYERLFLLTPDTEEPQEVRSLDDERVIWINFKSLSQAIDDLLGDDRELVSEKEELLLRELQALFEEDNLLGDPRQVVVVPARTAYGEYLNHGAYVCQPRRTFKHVERIAFYRHGQIEREIPSIRRVFDEVEFSHQRSAELRASTDLDAQEVADLIDIMIKSGPRQDGELFKVFLLTKPDDPGTVVLDRPVLNDATDANGRTAAWVQMQRYASLAGLQSAQRTSRLSGRG